MSKTVELRKIIKTQLEAVENMKNRVFFQEADKDIAYPYIVYDITSVTIDTRDNGILTVDVWDNAESTNAIEILTDNIEKQLNEKTFNNANIQAAFFINVRNNIVDEDKSLSRRQLRFEIQYYSKEE